MTAARAVLVLTALVVPGVTARSEMVTVKFHGRLLQKTGSSLNFPGLNAGDSLTGKVTYNADATSVPLSENVVTYPQESPATLSLKVAGYTFSSEGGYGASVGVEDFGSGYVKREVRFAEPSATTNFEEGFDNTAAGPTIKVDGQSRTGRFFVQFNDSDSSILVPGATLPDEISPTVFERGLGELSLSVPDVFHEGTREVVFFDTTRFRFAIDGFVTVPEPHAGAMGCCLLLAVLSRRRPLAPACKM